jgi:ElaB/YqjD/DUF883 family membrane-anchored ribosome-binding protein
MNTAASASQNVRETASDARQGVREVRKAASETFGDVQSDLRALRDDFGRLTEQVSDIVSNKSNTAWRRARSSVDGVVSDTQDKGREAIGAIREVSDNFVDAIDETIKQRPYTTLALIASVAFLFGATWRR